MADYQLELRQVVDYPRCRIYREFMQTLIADRSIRTGGCSGLFYYVVLCSYANFRTSYRRIDGISYTVYPGEWICSITDITEWFRVRFHYQAFAILKSLQDRQLITFTRLGRGHIVKFSIMTGQRSWRRSGTALYAAQAEARRTQSQTHGRITSFRARGNLFLCIGGFNALHGLTDTIRALVVREVAEAMDIDQMTNPNVRKAVLAMRKEVQKIPAFAIQSTHGTPCKGVDDSLLSRAATM